MTTFRKPPTLLQLNRAVEKFNLEFPLGTEVILRKDDGTKLLTRVRSEAWVVGGHSVIAKVQGVAGGYSIDRISKAGKKQA